MRALVRILLGGLSGSGQRSFQQLATHRPHENKEIAYGILSGKVATCRGNRADAWQGRHVPGPRIEHGASSAAALGRGRQLQEIRRYVMRIVTEFGPAYGGEGSDQDSGSHK